MKIKVWLLLVLLAALQVSADVVKIKLKEYKTLLAESKYLLVMYHNKKTMTKSFFRKYVVLSDAFKDKNIVFASYDMTKSKKTAKIFGIGRGTVFEFFVNGVPQRMRSEKKRRISSLRKWVEDRTKYTMKEIKAPKDIVANDYSLLYYIHPEDKENKLGKLMEGISAKFQNFNIFKIPEKLKEKVSKKLEFTLDFTKSMLISKRKNDQHIEVYKGDINEEQLQFWCLDQEYPDWSEFNEKTMHWFEKEKMPILFYFFDKEDTKVIDTLREIAPKIKNSVLTVLADVNHDDVKKFAETNGFSEFPILTIMEHADHHRKFMCKMDVKDISTKQIKKCISKYHKGKLERFYKSEKDNENANPKMKNLEYVTGNQLDKLLDDKENYRLVYFYDNNTDKKNLKNLSEVATALISKEENLKLIFNIFNLQHNEHPEISDAKAGNLVLVNPHKSFYKLKPQPLTYDVILEFLEDHAPTTVYKTIMSARADLWNDL